ncbi:hypothetical protein [Nonomuraea sp. NPDC005650]|uniref:hypothetical protein n=1 Tax=Nonomuraea sp. NPDC005650 TaxID=3157045 RepID=UPI0033B9567E
METVASYFNQKKDLGPIDNARIYNVQGPVLATPALTGVIAAVALATQVDAE